MNTRPIRSDARYTVTLEWCGQPKPQFIVRFCDDWVGYRSTYPAAVLLATNHRLQRQGALTVVGQPATP